MFFHYVRGAVRNLVRTPWMTMLIVSAVGIGIGASMTMLTVLHVMSADPLPGRSRLLYQPHLDPLPASYQQDYGDGSDWMTWPDAQALLTAHKAVHQAAMAGASLLVWPVDASNPVPTELDGRFTTPEIFAMFGIPLVAGSGWSQAQEDAHARVVVLSETLARRLFGRSDPIGQTVQLTEKRIAFVVTGVTRDWAPHPMFQASAKESGLFGDGDAFYLPLATALELDFPTGSGEFQWGEHDGSTTPPRYTATDTWLQMWVQLDSPAQAGDYAHFLRTYVEDQHALGRFERGVQPTRLDPLMTVLSNRRLIPEDVGLQALLALGFLAICMVNIVALLLSRFLRRSHEVGVRRALGARRRDIFMQFGVEAGCLGIAGGVAGLLLAQFGLWSIRQRPDDYARAAQMDLPMLAVTLLLATAAVLLAGLLPAWRASRIGPALQIKVV